MGVQARCCLTQMIKGTGRLDELTRLGEEAGQIIRSVAEERGSIVVVNHFDADGISAGSIVLAALNRIEASTHLRIVETLSEKIVEEVEGIESDLVIFADIGSGYLDLISKGLPDRRIIVSDHHQALGKQTSAITHFNPTSWATTDPQISVGPAPRTFWSN